MIGHRARDLEIALALASSEPDRGRTGRIALAVAAATAVALGTIGWIQLDADDPTTRLDALALVHHVGVLFLGDASDSVRAPLALGIARLLAPVVAASAAVALALGALEERLHRRAARSSRDHRLVVGPGPAAAPYLVATRAVVHATEEPGAPAAGTIRTRVDLGSPAWLRGCGALAAAEVVIATGDDDRNVQLLDDLVDAGRTGAVSVEIRDPRAAAWLAVAVAGQAPERDITVLDPSADLADGVRTAVLHEVGERGGAATVALFVRGPVGAMVAATVVEALADQQAATDAVDVPVVALVQDDDDGLTATLGGRPHRVVVHAATSTTELVAMGLAVDVAVVVGVGAPGALRQAVEVRSRWPAAVVYSTVTSSIEVAGIRALPHRHQARAIDAGVFAVVARARAEESGPTGVAWADRPPLDRGLAVAAVRRLVRGLVEAGHTVGPSSAASPAAFLPAEVCGRLAAGEGLDAAELAPLPFWLRAAGLAVDPQPAPSHQAVALPGEDVIEALARAAHASYAEHHGGVADWDEVAPVDQASNRDQARHAVLGLQRSGYGIAAGHAVVGAVASLPADVVDALARREHDRWAELKRAHGWRHGRTRDDDRLRHPDLVAWDDLAPAVRQKDATPMEELPGRLAELGFAIVDATGRTAHPHEA